MTNLIKGLGKGIIITTISVPVIIIGMNVAGRMLDKIRKPKDVFEIK